MVRRADNRGFTLIELMAVVAILAVLVAVAVPKFIGALLHAKNAKAISEISTINLAVQQYRVAHSGKLPAAMADLVPEYLTVALVDPWGVPYTYNNFAYIPPGARRKDGPLVPINREYDIFSNGADMVSAPSIRAAPSLDDIVLASDGDFINLATEY